MATTLTKNTKNKQPYVVWEAADITNGDILGIKDSLGHSATTVIIESIGGESTLRLNVSKKLYGSHASRGNKYLGFLAPFFRSPLLVQEIEEVRPNVIIELGDVQIWDKFPIDDIKVISKAAGLRIKAF